MQWQVCPNPEQCQEEHNPVWDEDGKPHHYGCGCGGCLRYYRKLKG